MLVALQVRPKGAGPFSWPHQIASRPSDQHTLTRVNLVEFDWTTVQASVRPKRSGELEVKVTGWSAGAPRDEDFFPWPAADAVIDAWFEAHDEDSWLWEFRMIAR